MRILALFNKVFMIYFNLIWRFGAEPTSLITNLSLKIILGLLESYSKHIIPITEYLFRGLVYLSTKIGLFIIELLKVLINIISHSNIYFKNIISYSNVIWKSYKEKLAAKSDEKIRFDKKFKKEQTYILLNWFNLNKNNPYPSTDQKNKLAKETELSIPQIEEWFKRERSVLKSSSKLNNRNARDILVNYFNNINDSPKKIEIQSLSKQINKSESYVSKWFYNQKYKNFKKDCNFTEENVHNQIYYSNYTLFKKIFLEDD